MPRFLHFWQGAVTYSEYLDMEYADWERMVRYMASVLKQAGR